MCAQSIAISKTSSPMENEISVFPHETAIMPTFSMIEDCWVFLPTQMWKYSTLFPTYLPALHICVRKTSRYFFFDPRAGSGH